MIGINDVAEELVDDVFIREIDLSQLFKPMTNNELTIKELKGIAGCGTFTGNAFRLDKSSTKFADRNQSKAIIHPDYIVDPIHKVGLDTGPINRKELGPITRER